MDSTSPSYIGTTLCTVAARMGHRPRLPSRSGVHAESRVKIRNQATYYMVSKVFNNVGFNDKCDSNTQSCLRVFNIISAYAMSRFYREIYHTWCQGWSFSVESGIGFIATSLLNQTSSPTLPTVPDMNLCPKVNLAVAKFRNRSCLFVPVI